MFLMFVDVFYLLVKMDFKLSQTSKGPERPAKVVHSELQKFPDSSLKPADQKSVSLALLSMMYRKPSTDFQATAIAVWCKCHTVFGANEKNNWHKSYTIKLFNFAAVNFHVL